MAHLPEAHAQFEFQKMQLIGSLGAVAETMRNCATIAEQFAQLISPIPYHPALALPNGPIQHMQPPPTLETPGGKRKREAEEKKKRKTKPKDPNAPKRPPSSYLFFQNEVRQKIKEQHPNIANNELLNLIAKAWNEMPKEEKDNYENRQKAAKELYLVEKAAYEGGQKAEHEAEVAALLTPGPALSEDLKVPSEPAATPSEDSSDEGQQSNSSSDDDEEEEEPAPAPKKARQPPPPPPVPTKQDLKKEKKSKKAKA